LLGRYQFKEALTSFLLHHAAPETAYPAAPASDRPNHAHLRRPLKRLRRGCWDEIICGHGWCSSLGRNK
jgi:hypothetical protein